MSQKPPASAPSNANKKRHRNKRGVGKLRGIPASWFNTLDPGTKSFMRQGPVSYIGRS